MEDNNYRLFKQIFGNIVISKLIFKFSRLYIKNDKIYFRNRIEMLEYPEREYIRRIEYHGFEMLECGDLPNSGVLKEICLICISMVKGDVIPYSVELIDYFVFDCDKEESTILSTLPSSIHTVKGCYIKKNQDNNNNYIIPPNITSLSLNKCPNISDGFIKIPNTIKELRFRGNWRNEYIEFKKGDIPNGVTSLSIFSEFLISNFKQDILPKTLKYLEIGNHLEDLILPNFISPEDNIEKLKIKGNLLIRTSSNLKDCKSIKTISYKVVNSGIEVNSLPSSLTKLNITFNNLDCKLEKNAIPNNVTELSLFIKSIEKGGGDIIKLLSKDSIPNSVLSIKLNKAITQADILPSSLKSLRLTNILSYECSNEDAIKMMSILPQSLSSISLPTYFKDFNLAIPSTINTVKYDQKFQNY